VFVKTPRRFDPHDKLVREYYRLEPYINGMVKNGRRNLRHEVSATIVQVLLRGGVGASFLAVATSSPLPEKKLTVKTNLNGTPHMVGNSTHVSGSIRDGQTDGRTDVA